jgi:intracellular sulfur oxidation DsrE/DsrF family protein
MDNESGLISKRRSFLTRLNAGAAGLAALALGGAAKAQVKAAAGARWEPARHEKDDWLESPSAKHRMVFDTTTSDGFNQALLFGSNFMAVNRSEYGLSNSDLSVVVVVRYRSVAFGYNDAIWAKYGAPIAARSKLERSADKPAPNNNVYLSRWDELSKQGVQLAVCSVATRNMAGEIAQATGGNAEKINSELIANLLSNARMVPAGIVAVNRAQERGYSLVS